MILLIFSLLCLFLELYYFSIFFERPWDFIFIFIFNFYFYFIFIDAESLQPVQVFFTYDSESVLVDCVRQLFWRTGLSLLTQWHDKSLMCMFVRVIIA